MTYLKMLGLAAVTALALVLPGVASASPLTSPANAPYTSTLKTESSHTALHGSFITVTCGKSTLESKVESHGSTSASGNVASWTFGECNYQTTVLKPGSLEIHAGESNRGTVTSTGAEIKIHTSVGECIFTTNKTDIGTITDTSATGSNAVLDLNSASIPRTGGNFFCGASGEWTGSYKFTTPGTLYVH